MKKPLLLMLAAIGCLFPIASGTLSAQESTIFVELFDQKLAAGWRWVAEDEDRWRVANGQLEIHTPTGGMHLDDAGVRNMLIRALPQTDDSLCVDVVVANRPEGLYENAGLVLYLDGSNYVRVNKESFAGYRDPPVILQVVSEVMGEFHDEHQNVSYGQQAQVFLRMRVDETTVAGFYRRHPDDPWGMIGRILRPRGVQLWAGVETSYGVAGADRWAAFDDFKIVVGCDR